MCGRYESAINHEELDKIFSNYIGKLHIDYDIDEVFKEENIKPTDRVRIIFAEDGIYKAKAVKWAIQSEFNDYGVKKKKNFFNNKIESTLKSSSNFNSLLKSKRCVFPATGFYEWPAYDKSKALRIFFEKYKIFFIGGIYTDKDLLGEEGASILTCNPNKFGIPIHNRMPVMLTPDSVKDYLEAPYEAISTFSSPLDDLIKLKTEDKTLRIKELNDEEKQSKKTGNETVKIKRPSKAKNKISKSDQGELF